MEIDIPTSPRATIEFKSRARKDEAMHIDREAGTIDDVIIIETGEAEGHGFSVDETFLEALVKYVNKDLGGRLQCNMGHRYDALFFQLGRFDKFKLSEDRKRVTAKLSVYKAADKSPVVSGMATWALDMAEEDPESIMCSIKFRPAGFYQFDQKGQKVYIQESWYGPVKQFKDKPAFAEFGKVFSCDIVESGALTDSLFSEGSQGAARTFGEIANAPGFIDWLRDHESQFPQLQQYYQDKHEFSLGKVIRNLFSHNTIPTTMSESNPSTKAPVEEPTTAAPVSAAAASDAPAVDLAAAIETALKPLRDQITALQEGMSAKDTEIAALKRTPAASPVGVKGEDPGRVNLSEGDDEPWTRSPINQRAASLSRKAAGAAAQ